jgi:hypothetical protein
MRWSRVEERLCWQALWVALKESPGSVMSEQRAVSAVCQYIYIYNINTRDLN